MVLNVKEATSLNIDKFQYSGFAQYVKGDGVENCRK